MCEICDWEASQPINWPWTDRNDLEEWTPEEDEDGNPFRTPNAWWFSDGKVEGEPKGG